MSGWQDEVSFSDLQGVILTSVLGCEPGSEEVVFTTQAGDIYKMLHFQDCCESVALEDVCGDVADLIGMPILRAEERTSEDVIDGKPEYHESFTWTFYEIATNKGSVTLRWLGESNGYYSEEVSFCKA